ncbi:MAG TPA: transcriptional regulator, partial [Acidobacteria bacterium]|nr:transcriptional regulator [Acidobacteriota bacterium]
TPITTPIATPIATPITTQETGETAQETAQEAAGTTQEPTLIATQQRLAELIAANPEISQQTLAVALGLTREGVKYHLNKLKRAGVLRHIGPPRGGRWEVLK